ncbi:MAG: hypothetical protein EKK61_00075 [Rickettsiales bacterium]|nr:MAG: hypothetical protein EKK61_00075 [Rickettsiales bacterium]
MDLNNFFIKSINRNNHALTISLEKSSEQILEVLNKLKEMTDDEYADITLTMPLIEKAISFQAELFKLIHNLSLENLEFQEYKNFLFISVLHSNANLLVVDMMENVTKLINMIKSEETTKDILKISSNVFNTWINITSKMAGNFNEFTLKTLIEESRTNNKVIK